MRHQAAVGVVPALSPSSFSRAPLYHRSIPHPLLTELLVEQRKTILPVVVLRQLAEFLPSGKGLENVQAIRALLWGHRSEGVALRAPLIAGWAELLADAPRRRNVED